MISIPMQKVTQFLFTAALAIISFQAQAEVRIMAVGDSITAGFTFGPPDGTGLGTASYRKEFENLLDQSGCDYRMVGSRNTNHPANPTVFIGRHEGYSAHRADHFITGNGPNAGIDAMMAAQSPDVVLLHLGSNDMDQSQTQASTVNEIENIISKILSANGNATILVANVIPWFGSSDNPNITDDIRRLGNQIISAVDAMGNPNVILVDVRSGYSESDMQQDLIHPNVDGENRMADAFAEAFENSGLCVQPDIIDPATFISTPSAGGSVSTTASFSGTATDTGGSGINRVQIAIERISDETSDRQWLNFTTGGFGPISVNGVNVGITNTDLTNTSLTSANWTFSTTLPAGNNYRVYALAVDNAGNDAFHGHGLAVWPVNRAFNVPQSDNTDPVDNTDPATLISAPAVGGAVNTNASFSGTATDAGGAGINRVQIAIQRTSDGQWLNFTTGGFGPISVNGVDVGITNTNLTNTSLTTANWNFSTTLPAGDNFRVYVLAVDNAGNDAFHGNGLAVWPVNRAFNVTVPDNINPTGTITSPTSNATVGQNSNITGTASDTGGSGVTNVQIAIRTLGADTQWIDFNGGFSSTQTRATANLSSNGNWSLPLPAGLGPNDYRIHMFVTDGSQNSSGSINRDFTISSPDNIDPTGTITSPTSNAAVGQNSNITGTASDNGGSGVASVEIAIRTLGSGTQWFDFSGAFSSTQTRVTANLSSNGNWSLPLPANLPADTYRIHMFVTDGNQNSSGSINRNFTIASPDNIAPTGIITSPASNATVGQNSIITGSASDTGGSGLTSVEIGIRTLGTGTQWFDFSGGFSSIQTRVTANLSSNGNWSLRMPANLPADTYRLHVFMTDGNRNSRNIKRNFVIPPSDNIKPSGAYINPASNQSTIAPDATITGTASDSGGSGVASVEIAIRTLGSNTQWFNFSGGFSSNQIRATAILSNNNANWSFALPANLPSGNTYRIHMFVTDGNQNTSNSINRDIIVTTPDTIDPTGAFTNPASNGDSIGPNSSIKGTASDSGGSGVVDVRIAIRTLGSGGQWLDFNGGFSSNQVRVIANLSNNGNWSLPLPPGLDPSERYRIHMFVTDGSQNTSNSINRDFVLQ